MKIPALKAKIGTWDYYVTTLTFKQVNDFVSKVDDQLHKSDSLKDLIQRSITENYISIKEYIIKQPELFFNSLVLAVYDHYPDWREIEFKYDDLETYKMGILEFPGEHKVFPVDGQHRVEGIKAALKENPELANETIAAIFIGHKNDVEGKRKTRRLFTTLNRYAKPVNDDDIIALDEDDIAAIITRELLEEYDLFTDKRVVYAKQKAIPSNNKEAITSIITLYQANVELLKYFLFKAKGKKLTLKKLEDFLKFRPSDEVYSFYRDNVISFWDSLKSGISIIEEYLQIQENAATDFRNNQTGGNLIFRPIGFLPIVKAALAIRQREGSNFDDIFKKLNAVNLNLDSKPWHYVLWNPIEHKMLMNSDVVCELMLLYLYDEALLEAKELKKLKEGYAAKISIEDANEIENILNNVK